MHVFYLPTSRDTVSSPMQLGSQVPEMMFSKFVLQPSCDFFFTLERFSDGHTVTRFPYSSTKNLDSRLEQN